MILSWAEAAWEAYLYWQQVDKKVIKRINLLIRTLGSGLALQYFSVDAILFKKIKGSCITISLIDAFLC